jgi:hypothetical protein
MTRIRIFIRLTALVLSLFAFSKGALADSHGLMDLGVQYDGWNANTTTPFNGYEILVPFSIGYQLDPGWKLYGQTGFVDGSYTDSIAGTETLNLSDFTDSVVGSQFNFQSFGTPSLFNVALNIPTGNSSWETEEEASNIPTEFIDTRYLGRGWGASALYGLSFPDGKTQLGAAAGYYYAGAFNPNYGILTSTQLKLGDAFFLALNRVEDFHDNQNSIFRVSGLYSLPSQEDSTNVFQMGPNVNASYAFNDPKGLSYEIGGEFFLPSQRLNSSGVMATEPHNSFGQRFYLAPTLALGDWSFAGMVKYITANDYSPGDYSGLYDGGGLLLGINPSYRWTLDAQSSLNFLGGYDFIIHHNAGADADNNPADVDYSYWTLGATYEIKI